MGIQPLQDRILVRPIDSESMTKSGIIIPETAKEKSVRGYVVAVGTGRVLPDGSTRPLDVKVGNRVVLAKYGGSEIKVDGETLSIVREDDILGVETESTSPSAES